MPFLARLLRVLIVWALIALAETVLGGARRAIFGPETEFVARQVAVFVSVGVIFAIAWAGAPWMGLRTWRGALAAGVLWAALTVAFDGLVGLALGYDAQRFLEDYDLANGGMMPVGLVLMVLIPLVVMRLRRPGPLAAG